MTKVDQKHGLHATDTELADYLSKDLSGADRQRVEKHIASCDECREKAVTAYESVKIFKKLGGNFMKKLNIYLILAIISFALSFIESRFFLQFLTATLLLGIKWVTDSKSTKMLVMIYDAWKRGQDKEVSRILTHLDKDPKNRL